MGNPQIFFSTLFLGYGPLASAPRRFDYLITPILASQEPVTEASRTFTIFMVRTIPVHARFYGNIHEPS